MVVNNDHEDLAPLLSLFNEPLGNMGLEPRFFSDPAWNLLLDANDSWLSQPLDHTSDFWQAGLDTMWLETSGGSTSGHNGLP